MIYVYDASILASHNMVKTVTHLLQTQNGPIIANKIIYESVFVHIKKTTKKQKSYGIKRGKKTRLAYSVSTKYLWWQSQMKTRLIC